MPDWSYCTLFYPLLRQLRGPLARDLTLQAMGALAALPGGPALIAAFGDMDPPAGLSTRLAGVPLRSPLGIAADLDPRLLGTRALARLGVGFVEVGPVTVDPLPEAAGPLLDVGRRSISLDDAPVSIGLRATSKRLDGTVGVPIVARISALPGANPAAASDQLKTLIAELEDDVAAFVLETRWTHGDLHQLLLAARAATRRPLLLGLSADPAPEALSRLVRAGLAAGVDGWVISGGLQRSDGKRVVGPDARLPTEATVRKVRALGAQQPIAAEAGVTQPADAVSLRAAGADFVLLHSGLVTAGPGLPKRINEALAPATQDRESAWPWLVLLGLSMLIGGVLAWLVAAVRVVLPYDEAFLGMSRDALQELNPRLLAFMAHDRVSLAGTMLSIGALYTGLAGWGARSGARWAWVAIVCSASVGFASFFLFLGFGYFDPLHATVSVVLLAFFVAGLRGAPRGVGRLMPGLYNDRRWRLSLWGQLGFVSLGLGLVLAGLGIALIGINGVLVPEDIGFLRTSADILGAVNPRLMPLVAHDRAGFGGALVSDGIGVLLLSLWGFRAGAAWVWWTLVAAGSAGFGAALAVHFAVGYLDPLHLAPAIIGSALFLVAARLSYPYLCQTAPTRL